MNITTVQRDNIMNYVFGSTAYTPPAHWYLGLSTDVLDDSGNVTGEPTTGSYARVAIDNDKSAGWSTSSTGVAITNKNIVAFATSSGSWGAIKTVFLASSSTGNNVCYYAAADPTFSVVSGISISFPIGDISLSLE